MLFPMLNLTVPMKNPLAENKPQSIKDVMGKVKFHLPKAGDILEVAVISASKRNVLLDLGALGTGIVYPAHFYDNSEGNKNLKPGDKIKAVLIELENEDGYRELSLKEAQTSTSWQDIKEKFEKGEVITAKILNMNKGGLVVEINGIQGFMPLSQLIAEHYPKVEGGDTQKIVQALQKYRNQEFKMKIIDYSEREGILIVSEKAAYESQVSEKISKYKVGDIIEGKITDVTDFGAFVKVEEGIEGLIHISEIDWKIIDNPKEVLKIDDEVKVKVISLEGQKLSLSLKQILPDPWESVKESFQVGQLVKGKVLKFNIHGCFIEVGPNVIGLVPSAEFANKEIKDKFEEGKEYDFAILEFNPEQHRMILTPNAPKTESNQEI